MNDSYQKHELHRAYAQEIMDLPKIIDTRRRSFLCHVFYLALCGEPDMLYREHLADLRKQLNSIEDKAQKKHYTNFMDWVVLKMMAICDDLEDLKSCIRGECNRCSFTYATEKCLNYQTVIIDDAIQVLDKQKTIIEEFIRKENSKNANRKEV